MTTPSLKYDWIKAADDGGGYCNVVAAHPKRAGYATAGGDTWGPARTTKAGALWAPRCGGATTRGAQYGRAVAYSAVDPNTSYLGVGGLVVARAGSGAFCAITDGSMMLEVRSTKADFSTNLPKGNAGDVPRAVGNLIRVVTIAGVEHIYAMLRGGFGHSTDGGTTWQITPITVPNGGAWSALTVLADGSCLASSFRNPSSTLFRISNPTGSPTVSTMPVPYAVEDLLTVGAVTYAACASGFFVVNTSNMGIAAGGAPPGGWAGTHLSSLAIDSAGVLYAGNGTGDVQGRSIARSIDAGKTWAWATHKGNVSLQVLGSPARTWWLAGDYPDPTGRNYSCSQLAVDKGGRTIYSAGRGGMLISSDAGATWQVGSRGLNGSDCGGLKIAGANVTVADTDYSGFVTGDRGVSVVQSKNPGSFPAAPFKQTVQGHAFELVLSAVRDFTVDGQSVASPYFQGACSLPTGLVIGPDLSAYVSLSGGGLLVGSPS